MEDRLVSLFDGQTEVRYSYDDDGLLVGISGNNGPKSFLLDINLEYSQVLEERDGDSLVARYTHAGGIVSQERAGETYYYHNDALGSVHRSMISVYP